MPLLEQYLIDAIVAPAIACVWWLLSRGWAAGVQMGDISDRTRVRQKTGFFVLLVVLYLGMFGMTTYVYLRKR